MNESESWDATLRDCRCLKPSEASMLIGVSPKRLLAMVPRIYIGPRCIRYPLFAIRPIWNEIHPIKSLDEVVEPIFAARRTPINSATEKQTPRFVKRGIYSVPVFPITGQVYFITDGQLVKIGFAKKPLNRIAALQTASSKPLSLLARMRGSYQLEHFIHTKFKHLNERGEWFRLTTSLVHFINNVASWKYSALSDIRLN